MLYTFSTPHFNQHPAKLKSIAIAQRRGGHRCEPVPFCGRDRSKNLDARSYLFNPLVYLMDMPADVRGMVTCRLSFVAHNRYNSSDASIYTTGGLLTRAILCDSNGHVHRKAPNISYSRIRERVSAYTIYSSAIVRWARHACRPGFHVRTSLYRLCRVVEGSVQYAVYSMQCVVCSVQT